MANLPVLEESASRSASYLVSISVLQLRKIEPPASRFLFTGTVVSRIISAAPSSFLSLHLFSIRSSLHTPHLYVDSKPSLLPPVGQRGTPKLFQPRLASAVFYSIHHSPRIGTKSSPLVAMKPILALLLALWALTQPCALAFSWGRAKLSNGKRSWP
jgi:hypothetical protein